MKRGGAISKVYGQPWQQGSPWTCAVCGKSVEFRGTAFRISRRDITVTLCGLDCMAAFARDAEPYLAALWSGCATYQEEPPLRAAVSVPTPLSLAEIRDLSARGESEDMILNKLRASRAVYQLSPEDVAALQDAKVSAAVIDYLPQTPELFKAPSPPRMRTAFLPGGQNR